MVGNDKLFDVKEDHTGAYIRLTCHSHNEGMTGFRPTLSLSLSLSFSLFSLIMNLEYEPYSFLSGNKILVREKYDVCAKPNEFTFRCALLNYN